MLDLEGHPRDPPLPLEHPRGVKCLLMCLLALLGIGPSHRLWREARAPLPPGAGSRLDMEATPETEIRILSAESWTWLIFPPEVSPQLSVVLALRGEHFWGSLEEGKRRSALPGQGWSVSTRAGREESVCVWRTRPAPAAIAGDCE